MCTVEGGVAATIPAGESKSFTYTCGFTGTPDLSGKNTAYATWSETTAATPTGTAFGDADVTMEQIQRTNDTVTVTDSLTGETYGSFDWTKGVQHITYTLHPTGTPGSCTSYNNTARIVETTGDEASATAELCVGSDVKVTKKASGSYDRTYLLSLIHI